MKIISKYLLFGLVGLAPALNAQLVLQNFSNVVGANTAFYGTWEATGNTIGSPLPNSQFVQGAGVFDITGTGVTDAASSKIEFFNSPSISIGSNAFISVTAQALSGNTATSFAISLIDDAGKTASAAFDASLFATGSYSTVLNGLTFQSGFNGNLINSLVISGNQPGGSAVFSFSFDLITSEAVPEPSTYALLVIGLGAVALPVLRRRRS